MNAFSNWVEQALPAPLAEALTVEPAPQEMSSLRARPQLKVWAAAAVSPGPAATQDCMETESVAPESPAVLLLGA